MSMTLPEFVEKLAPWNQDVYVPAGADLSAKQYQIVTVDSLFNADVIGSASAPIGILQNAPLIEETARVRRHGISRVVLSGTVSKNDLLMVDTGALGKVAKFTKGTDGHTHSGGAPQSASLDFIVGYALEDGVLNDAILCVIIWQVF